MHDPQAPSSGDDEARRVAVLPEALANQIAAGEVVERPASVVKELVENALDAGATRVLVDLEEAGRGLVRVVDDGHGMAPEDAALAVLRHATSKVRRAEDLEAIGTLGFRGEALPSIASVSRFTLVTRRAGDEAATCVKIEGGAAPVLSEVAAPVGTRIEVRDLFWNVPARLKFLKTDATEAQHVVDLVKGFALGYPHIHFRLGTGERGGKARAALDFPAVKRLFERVVQVLGKDVGKHLFEVELGSDAAVGGGARSEVRVRGFVSNAREAKATQSAMTTFVNGRRVKDRTVTHAVVSGFGSELAPGRFPQAVLWIYLDPADVDVNVHPAKAEVRFRQPQVVHEAVTRAIQAMLVRRPWLADRPLPLDPLIAAPAALEVTTPRPLPLRLEPRAARPSVEETRPRTERPDIHRTELRFGAPPTLVTPSIGVGAASPPAESPLAARSTRPPSVATPLTERAQPRTEGAWRLVGRARGAVIVEGPGGLALLDPEAALAAVTRAALAASPRPIACQPLLIPARLDLAPHEGQRLRAKADALAALGVAIEPFGGATHQLVGLPLPALAASPPLVLAELAALVGRGDPGEAELIAALARVAARGQIARGPDAVTATLVEHAARLVAERTGAFLLPDDELARRLAGGRA